MSDPFDVVVVGAGAAGILAAWRAGQLGARVLLLEKTPRIGTKILISGGGKCNVAHHGPLEDVIRAFSPAEARFLRPACYRLSNDRIMRLMTDRGLELYTRPDGRVFPLTATAKDVVAILVDYLMEAKATVCLDSPVTRIQAEDSVVRALEVGDRTPRKELPTTAAAPAAGFGAKALLRAALQTREPFAAWSGDRVIECGQVVVATGGSSYPASGTTGDGWAWMRSLGHTVAPLRPALAPIYLTDPKVGRAGVAVRDCLLKARRAGKEAARARGDLLFTHQGISGPATLQISRAVAEDASRTVLEVDMVPDIPFDALSSRIQAWSRDNPRRPVSGFLETLMPDRLAEDLLADAEIDTGLLSSRLERRLRNRLISMLKGWPIGEVRVVPLEKGEVVAGGVLLDEVDSQTMRSKLIEGLYLCGEILDVAGPVGGYNLQAAFATGFVAGETAARAAGYPM